MAKIKEFLKNKAIGYYIVAANIVLALVLTLIFFLTYKGAMANNAAGSVPETIGIFLIAGAIVEVVVLVLPQYRFIQVAAIAMFGLALYKEILLIPNLIADYVNKVFYQGGNLGTNVFYLVMLLIICIASIVAVFLGFYKKEEESDADMKIGKGDISKIIKASACGVVVIAAVLASSLVASDMQQRMAAGTPIVIDGYNPLTPELEAIAAQKKKEYGFNPDKVLIKEKKEEEYTKLYKTTEFKNLKTTATRSGHHMVYYFEGAYAEGYQGDYSETYGNLYLWDDGMFGGKINDTAVKGFWFNSSLEHGKRGFSNVKDCLKMVSNVKNYESIIAQETDGFYQRSAYVYLGFSWGTRSMILNGYKYYPEAAIAIDPSATGTEFYVGDTFDKDSWVCDRILANCTYSSVFKASEVKWTWPTGLTGDGVITLNKVGEYTVKATWNKMTTSKTIKVSEVPEEPAQQSGDSSAQA